MKKIVLLILITLVAGCSEIENSKWKSNPKHRAYISTRLADAIIEYNILTDEVVVEEQCDGSGWITQGDGHRTECPGCDACQSSEEAQEIEWSTESRKDNPKILEEFEITKKEEVIVEPEAKSEPVKTKKPLSKLFRRRK
jgi:hypothetical protein